MNWQGKARFDLLPDAGNQPEPTPEKIEYYKRNRQHIVPPIVKSSLRRHPQDVLHGSQSLNMLLPSFPREPGDWDMYSPKEKERALALESAIDRKVGADIASTVYIEIPKATFGGFQKKDDSEDDMSKNLYRVITPHVSNDAEIDVMDKPPNLPTVRHNGITHESLESQYKKSVRRQHMQPMKASKARTDQTAIEDYWNTKGIIPPETERLGTFSAQRPLSRPMTATPSIRESPSIRMEQKRPSKPLWFRV